jgi:hypothetical protein
MQIRGISQTPSYPDSLEDDVSSVDGTWNTSMSTPMGKQDVLFTFVTDGDTLTGTATQGGQSTEITDGSADGDNIEFGLAVTVPMPLNLQFSLAVAGDAISGTVKAGPFPPIPLTGTRA